ncbi:putative FAD binding domain/FAD linked oxidases, C-terminal domain containing protein [Balamuthia mandrillaris]
MERADVWQKLKWNGWGEKGAYYDFNHRGLVAHSRTGVEFPKVMQFAKDVWDLDTLDNTPSVDVEEVLSQLPEPLVNEGFVTALKTFLSANQVSFDGMARLCHTYGSSLRDLMRLHKGIISEPPDVVVFPQSHEDVERLVQAAHTHDVALIPCGGRTNIVGACEPERDEKRRMIVSVDLRRMNKVLWIDKKTMTACIEVGILGPDMEDSLQREGVSLGHDPDSFQWSTLGGWLATCSSGMQSDKYGDIEDMCVSLKIVTPTGTITTPAVPRNGSGPTMKHFFVGSEGTLGIITQAVMKVHAVPPVQEFHAFLFPRWEDGLEAIHHIVRKEALPAMIRLYDPQETQMSFSIKPRNPAVAEVLSKLVKKYLEKIKGFDMKEICLMIVGFEGEAYNVKHQKGIVKSILKQHKGFGVGTGPGKSWYTKRYELPMFRDFLLNHGMWVDVAESSMSWSNALALYQDVKQSTWAAIETHNVPGWVGAHVSHTYSNGVCIYFHYASLQTGEGDEYLNVYLDAKKAATEAILRNGGALSHHHGVGFEHVPWMGRYFDEGSLRILRTLKHTLDPKNVCNPGKLLPAEGKEDPADISHLFHTRGITDAHSSKSSRL